MTAISIDPRLWTRLHLLLIAHCSRLCPPQHESGAFLFPQMQMRMLGWKPGFVDYLFLAFNTSTAFSPTDVPVLSRWAKVMMMVQSSISLGTVVILAGRAVNIL